MSVETSGAPPLETRGLVKRFSQGGRQVEALSGVSLRVDQGEFVAIMGASGSGKSTLLHLAAGLTAATEGEVRVAGQNLGGMSDRQLTLFRRNHIGIVFQSLNLSPALTAEENVLLPLHAASNDGGRAQLAAELLERLGLGDRRGHLPSALSGGEQQRVALARALVTEPALILADEPTGSLDSANSRLVCETMRRLNEAEGRTIVVVTHEPTVAAWADRVVVLKDGLVLTDFAATEYAGPQELASHYQDITSSGQPAELAHGIR